MKGIKQLADISQKVIRQEWFARAVFVTALIVFSFKIRLPQDASPLLQNIFNYTVFGGAIFLIAVPSIRAAVQGNKPSISGFITGFAWLAVVACVLSVYGDSIITFAKADPMGTIAIAISVHLVRLVSGMVPQPSNAVAFDFAHGTTRLGSRPQAPTLWDDEATAAHEAGHALLHAALDRLPDGFVAVIEQNSEAGWLGFVTGVGEGTLLTSRVFSEWRMLMLLSGKAGEKALRGCETLGAKSDYQYWLAEANSYLSSGFNGEFYASPQSDVQRLCNKQALDDLQQDQEATLDEFFALNRVAHAELSNALLNQRRLDIEALSNFMERVKFPGGFPLPKELNQ